MAREVARLRPAAELSRWAVVDSECFGRELERLVYYDTVMRPHHGRTTLMGFLRCHGRHTGIVVLGRSAGSSRFRARDLALLADALPVLSLAQKSYSPPAEPPHADAASALTAREREVWSYLRLGYTNQQIALALGSAPRTVRNQLSRVYEKLGVSGRAEAVAAFDGTIVPSTDRVR
jgi:DNA-binding CsgD family transcriptional regulator